MDRPSFLRCIPPTHSVTFSAFIPPSCDIFPLPNDYTDLPTLPVTCVSVSLARVFTSDLLLEPYQCLSSSLLAHVCVCVCVCVSTPAWLNNPDISFFPIRTHSVFTHLHSLQHTLLHMLPLSIFAACHPKKGSNWQSVFRCFKERPLQGK